MSQTEQSGMDSSGSTKARFILTKHTGRSADRADMILNFRPKSGTTEQIRPSLSGIHGPSGIHESVHEMDGSSVWRFTSVHQ